MDNGEKARSRYFREISNSFFKHRGAPFFLSPKDLDLVASWEKMKIPLDVVLEGMEKAFEYRKSSPKAGMKVRSLSFCDPRVMKAFEVYKEKRVGRSEKTSSREEKAKRIKREVERFLRDVPPPVETLRKIFEEAQRILSSSAPAEEELERLDHEVEETLLRSCPPEEKETVRGDLPAEYDVRKEERNRVFRLKLVKGLREKHGIPYLAYHLY